jgi:hypothetical protein
MVTAKTSRLATSTPSHGPDDGTGRGGPNADVTGPRVTCGFCGLEFVEDRSQAACQACPLSIACGLMRCPHCGYENAREPAWITRIKEWVR